MMKGRRRKRRTDDRYMIDPLRGVYVRKCNQAMVHGILQLYEISAN